MPCTHIILNWFVHGIDWMKFWVNILTCWVPIYSSSFQSIKVLCDSGCEVVHNSLYLLIFGTYSYSCTDNANAAKLNEQLLVFK